MEWESKRKCRRGVGGRGGRRWSEGGQGPEATADRVNCVQVTDGQWLGKTPYNRKSSFLSHCPEKFVSRTSGRKFY